MDKILFCDYSIKNFLDVLASSSPIPGGGPLAALTGAQACALGEMVCNITLSNKKYADIKDEVCRIVEKLSSSRNEFLNLMEKDAEGFDALMKVFARNKDSFTDADSRKKIVDNALKKSAAAPISMSELCVSLVPLFVFILERGNKNLLSDSIIAAKTLCSCFFSAVCNVRVNINYVSDKSYVDTVNSTIEGWFSEIKVLEDALSLKSI